MSRRWTWAQLVIGYVILEAALWTSGRTQAVFSYATAVWIVASVMAQRRSARELGLGRPGFTRALVAVPVASLAAGTIVLTGWAAGSLRVLYGPDPVWAHTLGYSLWALFQQFMLQSFFYLGFETLFGPGPKAMWTAVVLFAAAHIPNPVLVPASFVGALFFVLVFRRTRNIYPLGLAHAVLGLALAVSVPDGALRHMRVGASYFRYQPALEQGSAGAMGAVQHFIPGRLTPAQPAGYNSMG